jgi:hypothetical protein
MAAAY